MTRHEGPFDDDPYGVGRRAFWRGVVATIAVVVMIAVGAFLLLARS